MTEEAAYRSPIVRFAMWGFGILLLISAPIAAYATFADIQDARASASWPTTAGQVTESGVEVRKTPVRDGNVMREKTSYVPLVRYRFEVAGKTHSGSKIRIFESAFSEKAEADLLVNQYRVGSQVTVHYNPERPSIAVLEPGIDGSSYLRLLIPVALLAFGVLACYLGHRLGRKS